MTIPELTKQLQKMSGQLEEGRLTTAEILEMSDFARKLYEQVIVLRHKTFEEGFSRQNRHGDANEAEPEATAVDVEVPEGAAEGQSKGQEAPAATNTPTSPEVVPDPRGAAHRPETVAEPELKTGYSPAPPPAEGGAKTNAQVAPNQISLIDSIEEIRRMEKSLNDKFTVDASSLGDKLKRQPIHNLTEAIGINSKFRFISVLFDGNKDAFAKAIHNLDTCNSLDEARRYMDGSLSGRFNWDAESEEVSELIDLVERRYL